MGFWGTFSAAARNFCVPVVVVVLLALGGAAANAETWTVPGMYTVKVDGWTRNAIPEGFNYRCLKCTDQIEIEVMYGPPFGPDALWKTNDEFIAALSTEDKRKTFADAIMKGAIPSGSGFKVEIKKVSLDQIGGLRVLMMASEVMMGTTSTMDTSMIAVHKNRLVRVTVHFFKGALTAESGNAINAFMDGLVFEK